MGVPATTGQLRTKVSDMKIGDYIAVRLYITSGQFMFDWNTSEIAEFPLSGSPLTGALNGVFYFIKTAKGMLVGDRVCAHTVTWDALNGTHRAIQGRPIDFGTIIPTMTSNTSPSGVASASSIYNATYDAFGAFDKKTDSNNAWVTLDNVLTGWLAYEFPEPKTVVKYAITSRNSTNRGDVKNWTFEGWNDTTQSWEILDTRGNEPAWGVAEKRSYSIANKVAYKKYRINVTAITLTSSTTYLSIGELEMMDTVGTIRSLTGGVAYADANGNSSTIDISKGAFPTNNEWDRYIANFNSKLIQSGKTIDDVFHWKISTWTQDTPSSLIQSNITRVARGHTTAIIPTYFATNTSSASNTGYGFRPVFEYQEV